MDKQCPECGSTKYKKDGISQSGFQRYCCHGCGRRWTDNSGHMDAKTARKVAPMTMDARQQLLVAENSQLKAQIRELTRENYSTTKLRELIHSLDTANIKPPRWLNDTKTPGLLGTPTLFLSDLHWGEAVFKNQVNGCNEYGMSVAQRRLERVFASTNTLLRDYLKGAYDGIVVALGGDIVSGNIHEELRETNEQQIFAIVLDALEHLTAGIRMMADEFGKVFVPCVVGNHGRIDRKPRAKGAVRDNYEWILYQFLAREFANDDRVTVAVSESLDYIYKVQGLTYLLTHGDQFRGGTGITGPMVPWALGDHRKRKRQDAIKQPYDVMIFGHWHQLFWGNGGFLCNGSLKGYDEYSYRSNFPYQAPMQALWITHQEKGITFQMPVLAEETVEPEEMSWVSLPASTSA